MDRLLRLATLAALFALALPAWAQVQTPASVSPVSYTGGTYSQDFGTLASSGTSDVLPGGWAFQETGTGANATYAASDGTANGGNTYSFGVGTDADRAFGTILSGSVAPVLGVAFTNSSGQTLTDLTVGYTGEQWRLGALGRVDRLDFQYSVDATSLNTGTWVDVDALDFTAPVTAGTVGALVGNSAPNRTVIAPITISSLTLPAGATIWFRWVDINASSSDDGLAVEDFSFTSAVASGEVAVLTFNPDAATVTEGGTATPQVVLTISNDTGAPGLNSPASASIVLQSGDPADVGMFTPSVSFSTGTTSGSSIIISIPTVDDAQFEGAETLVFAFGSPVGASAGNTFSLTIADNDPAPAVVINEVDADQEGTDTAEYVEIRGPAGTSLSNLSIVHVNGNGETVISAFSLAGVIPADGFFVVCYSLASANCDQTVGSSLQNGADAVAIYAGAASNYPVGSAATTANVIDAVVYSNTLSRDPELLAALGQTVQYLDAPTEAVQRLQVNGQPSGLLYSLAPTVGTINPTVVTVDRTSEVADLAGYRFIGVPVIQASGAAFEVADLAAINLVQGVPGGSDPTDPDGPQYPNSPDNLFTGYFNGTYFPPTNTDNDVLPGRGAAWYWYDANIDPTTTPDPNNPGTSRSWDLADPGFRFALTGIPLDNRLLGAPYYEVTVAGSGGDGFYLTANPFAYPLRLGGVQVSTGVLSTNFQTWDPSLGTFTLLTANTANPWAGDALPVWNGAFAEVSNPGGTPVFRFSSAFADPTSNASFIGRVGTNVALLNFELTGTLAGGQAVSDYAARLRFEDDALVTWDRHDASKLMPPGTDFALIAPVGERDGAPRRQAVLSLPVGLSETVTFPVAFTATQSGSFQLTWSGALEAGLVGQLRDVLTGTVLDLATPIAYTFTAEAGDWADRFELVIGQSIVAGQGDPQELVVGPVSPNPTAATASVQVRTPSLMAVRATILDALGRTVAVVEASVAGESRLVLPTASLAAGAYLVRVEAGNDVLVRRLTVLR